MKPLEAIEKGYGLRAVVLAIEKEILLALCEKYNWNMKKVATECLMTTQYLRRKLNHFGISIREAHRSSED